jgi:DNA primase
MAEQWVDFGELKQRVSMEDILERYGLLDKLRSQKGGDELVGLCPFHQEKRRSFHVSVSKNAWQCFGVRDRATSWTL